MKTIQFITLAAGLIIALANPISTQAQPFPFLADLSERPAIEVSSLKGQISELISYPQILEEHGGITMITFQIRNNRITKVKVYSQNYALNKHITLCLAGKKVQMPGNSTKKEQMVRIHFVKA